MTVLREGRALPSLASLRGLAIPQSLSRPVIGSLLGLKSIGAVPRIRTQLLKGYSISNFSTWTPRTPLLPSKPSHPLHSPSRPGLSLYKARLAASLSTEAQRLLSEKDIDLPDYNTSGASDHQIGDFADLGFGTTWWPSDLFASSLEWIHVHNQLPWWACIAAVTLIIRVTLFPLMLRVARNSSIFPTIYHRAKPMLDETKRARASKDLVTMQKASNKLMTFYRDNGYSPLGGLTMLIQIPVFFSMFRMLWNGSKIPIPGWQTGGMWWFEDLTAIDPYFLLPTISGLTTCWTVMLNARDMPMEPRGALGLFGALSPFLSLIFVPVLGYYQPSCIFLYWCINNFFLLLQTLLFNWAPTRAFFGLLPRDPNLPIVTGKLARKGVIGAFQDRWDVVKLAWKNYLEDQARSRAEMNQIYKAAPPTASRTIKYETRKKGPADKKARDSGSVESLK